MKIKSIMQTALVIMGLIAFASCQKEETASAASGKITIESPWSLEAPETQTMSAGFLKITNGTAEDDALIAASSDVSETTELHEMAMEGETMKMRKIDRIPVKAGETVELKRGGLHLMFIGLTKAPVEGDTVHVELEFEKAGKMNIELPVKKDAGGMKMDHSEHH